MIFIFIRVQPNRRLAKRNQSRKDWIKHLSVIWKDIWLSHKHIMRQIVFTIYLKLLCFQAYGFKISVEMQTKKTFCRDKICDSPF